MWQQPPLRHQPVVDTPEDLETVNNLRHAKIALIYL